MSQNLKTGGTGFEVLRTLLSCYQNMFMYIFFNADAYAHPTVMLSQHAHVPLFYAYAYACAPYCHAIKTCSCISYLCVFLMLMHAHCAPNCYPLTTC